MDYTPNGLNEQLQRLYIDRYVPWARERGIEPIEFDQYRERVLEHCAQHVMEDQEKINMRQKIMNFKTGMATTPGISQPPVLVSDPQHNPVVMASFFVADRVSKKTMAEPNFIGGPHNPEESEMRRCMQCGFNVWVAKTQLEEAAKSEGILCIDCIPEMTGMSREEFNRQIRFPNA